MKWSLQLPRVAGIKIYIHWTFLILLIWIVFSQVQQGKSWKEVMVAVLFIITIFCCVVMHELGHALMARRFKIKTRDITLLPIGGLARLEKIPEKPKQELWVALAGPAVNVAISGFIILFFEVFKPGTFSDQLLALDQIGGDTFLANLLVVNLFLALFNMIPAFPMDGGRVFRALLAFKYNRVVATKIAVALGQFIAIGFALVGLMYNPVLIFIAIFVYLGAQFELEQVKTKFLLNDYLVGDIMMKTYNALQNNNLLFEAVTLLLDSQEKDFIVLQEGEVVGLLTSYDIIQGLKLDQGNKPIEEMMSKNFRQLDPKESLDKVYQEMQLKKYSVLPVVKAGLFVGILNMENIAEFIKIQNVLTPDGQDSFAQILHKEPQ